MKIFRFFSKNYKKMDKKIKKDTDYYLKKIEDFKPPKETKELLLKSDTLIKKLDKENIEFYSRDTIISSNTIKPQDAYKLIDSNFESYFNNRDYNLKNFNNLLLVLTEQNELEKAENVFEKMKLMNVKPNINSYIHLIQNYGKHYKLEKSEELFDIAVKQFGINKNLVNSLIFCYSRNHKPQEAEKILNHYKTKGIQPDLAIYTSLIVGYKNLKKTTDVWRLYDQSIKEGIKGDDVFYGLLIKICSDSGEAEKGKQLFELMIDTGFKSTCLPYNSLIKVFASRDDYAQEALETYQKMVDLQIKPDKDTFINLLKATSKLGDINFANNAMILMKEMKIPMNKYIINGLIKTYSGACKLKGVNYDYLNSYVEDSWKLFNILIEKKEVNVHSLNSMLGLHFNANMIEKAEELVLPMFSSLNIQMDKHTYGILINNYNEKRLLVPCVKIYDSLIEKNNNELITLHTLNIMIDTFIRLRDTNGLVHIFKKFKELKKNPTYTSLKKISRIENLPDEIMYFLKNFEKKFGYAKNKNYSRINLEKRGLSTGVKENN